jgi:uncharacterized membrane protein YkoI
MFKGIQKIAVAVVAAAALAVGAAVIADAASNKGSTGSQQGAQQGARNGTPPQRPDETILTDGTAQKVKDAALKKVPGASVIRVETDAEGSPYEAHLRKSDGSEVTAKVNKQFEVTDVQQGFGGGPGGPGGPRSGSSNGTSYGAPVGPSISG